MTRQKFVSIFFILFMLALAACGNSPAESAEFMGAAAPEPPAAEMALEEAEMGLAFQRDSASDASLNQSEPVQSRLIIRTADMSIVVTDTEEAMQTIVQMVESNGGWVVDSSVFQYDERAKTGNMTVRVPAEGFQSALDAIQGLALEVTAISTSGQDVTEEYVDLSARLANLEATADRVRTFLDEAQDVEEALAVNQELSRLEAEIESLKGRIQYLQQSSAFSTITVNLTPDILAQPIQVAGWQPEGVVRNAIEALINALQALLSLLIWLLIFVFPIVLLIGIPLWLTVRYIRRRRARRKAAKSEMTETAVQDPPGSNEDEA